VPTSNTKRTQRVQCLPATQRGYTGCSACQQLKEVTHGAVPARNTKRTHRVQCPPATQRGHTVCSACQQHKEDTQGAVPASNTKRAHRVQCLPATQNGHTEYCTLLFFVNSDNVVEHRHWLQICTRKPTVSCFYTSHLAISDSVIEVLEWKRLRLTGRQT
jgi:hypothetical protein